MEMKKIAYIESCANKQLYNGYELTKTKDYYNAIICREVIRKHDLIYTEADIEQIATDIYTSNQVKFVSIKEKDSTLEILKKRLMRLKEYVAVYYGDWNYIKGSTVTVTKWKLDVAFSFALEKDDNIILIDVKNKKNNIPKSREKDDLELFGLVLAGRNMYPNKKVLGKIIFLRDKEDSGSSLAPLSQYNKYSPHSVMSFCNKNEAELMQRIKNVIDESNTECSGNCFGCSNEFICSYVPNKNRYKILPPKQKASGKTTFTPAQQELIETKDGNYRVVAVAGAGKTTSIANRIATMIKDGINPSDIILVTFTNKGVQEMKEKISFWLNKNGIKRAKLNIYTYNSWGQHLLEREYQKFGFTAKPKLIDKGDAMDLIQEISDRYPEVPGLDYVNPYMITMYKVGAIVQLYRWFDLIKCNDITFEIELAELIEIPESVCGQILKMYNEFKNIMKANNWVDYRDQIGYLYDISRDAKLVKKYGYSYIIVDEFQDSDLEQIEILQNFAKYKYFKGIMVVGDDSQAIFSWRGAYSDYIIDFDKYFDEVTDIKLMENFRSSKQICELANNVISLNKNGIKKQLQGQFHGNEPEIKQSNNNEIALEIEQKIKNGTALSDIAVIARTKSQLTKMQDILNSMNIPSIISVSEYISDNKAVNIVSKFCTFLQDNSNTLYFLGWLKLTDFKGFSKCKKTKQLETYVQKKMSEFYAEWTILTDEEKFEYMIKKLKHLAKTEIGIQTLLDLIAQKKVDNLQDFYKLMINIIKYHSDVVIEKTEENVDAVVLTTAHSSKGREWETVYCNIDGFEKNYPTRHDYHALKFSKITEEERRLLFVAITRAKKELTIYCSKPSIVLDEVMWAS